MQPEDDDIPDFPTNADDQILQILRNTNRIRTTLPYIVTTLHFVAIGVWLLVVLKLLEYV